MMNILEEANELTQGPRQQSYGSPKENLRRIAVLWNVYLEGRQSKEPYFDELQINEEDVAMMMMLLKLARQMNSAKRDNLVDMCGYIRLIEMIGEKEVLEEPEE